MQAETVAGKSQKPCLPSRVGTAKAFAYIADDRRYTKAAKWSGQKHSEQSKRLCARPVTREKGAGGSPIEATRPLLGIDSIQGKPFFIPSEFYAPFADQNKGANNVRKELNSEAKNPILKL